jgi:hypothetical protein
MIKKVFAITLLLSLVFGSIAFAHSGRTDSSGGHNCSDKSKAKGLCTGYHSHNGGASSSDSGSSSGTTQPAATRHDKNCTDFGSYDEVVDYWNSKGYSATYDPENLDGWGNGVVDDGIPCEAPSGYDKTKINNSPEQAQQQQDEADKANGEEQGYAQGLKDGYNGLLLIVPHQKDLMLLTGDMLQVMTRVITKESPKLKKKRNKLQRQVTPLVKSKINYHYLKNTHPIKV